MPRTTLTPDEARHVFLYHVWRLIDSWKAGTTGSNPVEGVVFSMLSALDGDGLVLPSFKVCPIVPPEDKAFNASNGVLNFPSGKDIGPLHEHFHLFDAKSRRYDPAAVNQARKYFQSMERAFRFPESR